MFQQLLIVLAVLCTVAQAAGGNYHFLSTSDCEKVTSQKSCAAAACSWCESGAVGASCMSNEDAASLPSSVFTCTASVLKATTTCESITKESTCMSSSEGSQTCAWCTSGAVGASCMKHDDAAGLPSSVFQCSLQGSAAKTLAVTAKAPVSRHPRLGEVGGSWQWEVTMDMFEGVIGGFFAKDAPDLKSCAGDAESLYSQMDAAIKTMEGAGSTASKVEDGLQEMGNVLLSLSDLIKDCQGAEKEITSLVSTIRSGFTSPMSFLYHMGKDLVVNGVDIYHEIKSAEGAWEQQSYKECGNQIGMALQKLLVGR